MTKDEMKNRISMALKDPILQQGFECICKENAELKAQLESVPNSIEEIDRLLDRIDELKAQVAVLTEENRVLKAHLRR